jgi:hypothetical protein
MSAEGRTLVMAVHASRLHRLTLLRSRRRRWPVEHGVVAILVSLSKEAAGNQQHRRKCQRPELE